MIEAFSLKTAHRFGDALASQARLRYRVFVERHALDHTHYDGMEYDEFDTPAAVYLVWRDPQTIVRGLIRLVPTTVPYMLKTCWPQLCERRPLPSSPQVWESTRVCVDRAYVHAERKLIMPELLCAVHEFCSTNGYDAVVGVTRQHLLETYLPGKIEWLGATREIEGNKEAAFWVPTANMRPDAACVRYGITGPVLTLEPAPRWIAA